MPALACAVAWLGAGCASDVFGRGASHPAREDAIARCLDAVPADASRYEDRFAACMEGYGWVYAPSL